MVRSLGSCAVVINPRRYPEAVSRLEKLLEKTDVSDVVISDSKHDFIDSVKRFYAEDLDNILVWGGDGTAHDAINAIMESKRSLQPRKTSIGFLRGGSGNGIQDSYEVPHDIIRPLERQISCYEESIREGYTMDVDLIMAKDSVSSSYCQLVGLGFDAKVLENREAHKFKKGALKGETRTGLNNYVMSSLTTFFKDYDELSNGFTIEMRDGKNVVAGHRTKAEHRFSEAARMTAAPLIEIGTRPYYGKMFRICPDVVCNDGKMDLYVFNFEGKWDALRSLPWIYAGRHDVLNKRFARKEKPPIERYEVRYAKVSSPESFNYHIDGELKHSSQDSSGMFSLELEIVPEAISFLVPKSFYKSFHWFENDY